MQGERNRRQETFGANGKIEIRIQYKGTLEEFLKDHTKDFVDIRYYDWDQVENYSIRDLLGCFLCIVFSLASRDPDTKSNLDVFIESLNIVP